MQLMNLMNLNLTLTLNKIILYKKKKQKTKQIENKVRNSALEEAKI